MARQHLELSLQFRFKWWAYTWILLGLALPRLQRFFFWIVRPCFVVKVL